MQAFRRLLAFRRTELGIAVAAGLGVLAFDILYGTELLFPTLPTAVQAYQDRTKDPPAGNQGP